MSLTQCIIWKKQLDTFRAVYVTSSRGTETGHELIFTFCYEISKSLLLYNFALQYDQGGVHMEKYIVKELRSNSPVMQRCLVISVSFLYSECTKTLSGG